MFSCRLSLMLKKCCAINESRCGVASSDLSAFLNVSNFPYIFLIIDVKKYSSILQQVLLRSLFQSPGTPLVLSFLFFCITHTHMQNTVFLYQVKLSSSSWLTGIKRSLETIWMFACKCVWSNTDRCFLVFNTRLILSMNGLLVMGISGRVWAAFRLPKGPFKASSTAEHGNKPSSSNQNLATNPTGLFHPLSFSLCRLFPPSTFYPSS